MNELLINNTVNITGRIVKEPIYSHHVFGEGFYETTLEVSRLSDQVDLIPITVSDRLIAEKQLSVGKEITVEGQFRSYNKLIDGRSKLMLTVFVREILEEEGESPNNIELTGFICKEPIFRVTPFKREIADVLIAVNRAYNKSDYIPCIAWGRNAKFVSTLSVGTKITINGRIQSRSYQKQLENGDIEERMAYEISVNRLSLSED